MAELSSSDWSETDASNDVTPPAGWPAGMQPNQVEPTARGMMGAIKRFWNRINPTYTSGGSAGAYTFTPSNTSDPTAYVQGESFKFKANFTSIGGDTLNVNSLGALGIYKPTGSGPLPIAAGDIQNNTMVECAYDGALNASAGGFQLIAGQVTFSGSAAISATNKLINPFMEIDQANEGSSVTLSTGNKAYIVDGFQVIFVSSSAAVSAQRVNDAPTGYSNSLKITVGTGAGSVAGSDYVFIQQPIEGDNLLDTAFGTASAQTLTVTVWIKSSISGTYSGALRNFAGTRSYPFNLVLSSSGTWTKFTVTVPGDTSGTWVTSGNAGGMLFTIAPTVGSTFQGTVNTWQASNVFGTSSDTNTLLTTSSATFQLGPCKLEVSSVATPIVRTAVQQEMAQCQRYYEKSYDLGTAIATATNAGSLFWFGLSGSAAYITVPFKASKRAQPSTITIYSPNNGASGDLYNITGAANVAANVAENGENEMVLQATSSLGANSYLAAHWTADARL